MPNEFRRVPDGVQFENNHCDQILLAWMGIGSKGVPMRLRGSDGQDLLLVDDAGVRVSKNGVETPTNPFVYAGMVVGWDSVATVPSGYSVCDGTGGTPDLRGRFLLGVSGSHALGTTGGAETYDISHNHTQNAHTHPQDAHGHSHNHDFLHTHDHDHLHDYDIDHNHPTQDSGPAKTGASNSFETGDALAGVTQEYALQPHIHDTFIDNFITATQTTDVPVSETWTMHNNAFGQADSSIFTEVDGTTTVATNQNTTATNNTAGSTTQATIPPYYSLVWIRRMV